MKRFISLMMTVLVFLCVFTACSDNEEPNTDNTEETTTPIDETVQQGTVIEKKTGLVLPYAEGDSLNPYKAETLMNENICHLIYEGLYKPDESYSPIEILGHDGEIQGTYVSVDVKDEAQFSDGSKVSASDVAYSFNLAKDCEYYSELLSGFSSVTVMDNNTVKFALSNSDPYALSCLTFPIVKYGTGEDNLPVGTGRYTYSSRKLKYNKNHISQETPSIKTIELYDIKDNSKSSNALQIGNISFIYRDLSDCETERLTAITRRVDLNNIVFLGMNGASGKLLSDSNLRKIIGEVINKQDIAENAFQGYAAVADTPFNPNWYGLKDVEIKSKTYSALELTQLLEENGYTYANDTETVRSKKGKKLEFTILVNKNNRFKIQTAKLIQTSLKSIGISTEIEEVSGKELKSAIRKGKFDLYIGEIKLCENMSLSEFFSTSGSGRYGINKKISCISEYNSMLTGEGDISKFIKSFNEDMPFVPLCYRQGFAAAANELKDNIKVNSFDIYDNIYEWSFK